MANFPLLKIYLTTQAYLVSAFMDEILVLLRYCSDRLLAGFNINCVERHRYTTNPKWYILFRLSLNKCKTIPSSLYFLSCQQKSRHVLTRKYLLLKVHEFLNMFHFITITEK